MKAYYIPEDDIQSRMVSDVAVDYGLTRQQMAAMLGVSDKTFYNILKSPGLDPNQADRFTFMKNILDEGSQTFNGVENFRDWLHTSQPTLDGHKPVDMLSSLNGAQEVLAAITRIKYGIFA